MTETLSWR